MAFLRDDLCSLLYPNGSGDVISRQTLKAHIWQINEMIADEGYRIDGRGSSYRLVNVRERTMSRTRSIPSVKGAGKLASSIACGPKSERR